MATAKSGTLSANTVKAETVSGAWPGGVQVINRSQTGVIWVRLDGQDPTVAGDDSFPVLGVRWFQNPHKEKASVTVKMKSTAALDYTVEAAGAPWR